MWGAMHSRIITGHRQGKILIIIIIENNTKKRISRLRKLKKNDPERPIKQHHESNIDYTVPDD